MKRLLLLILAAAPLFALSGSFVYYNYGYDGEYWDDYYWDDYYWCDRHWVYYPHGHYCVHYVWYYPWWWDWYWWRCHWCHHFHWGFFYSGFYTVWYEGGHWWWRPRYGRWVKYRVPYSYHEMRTRAKQHNINLPEKPPRELNIPYKENEVMKLMKDEDPKLYERVEKEYKSGNLTKMQKDYEQKTRIEIEQKNKEHGITKSHYDNDAKAINKGKNATIPTTRDNEYKVNKNTPGNQVGRDDQYTPATKKSSSDAKGKSPTYSEPGKPRGEDTEPVYDNKKNTPSQKKSNEKSSAPGEKYQKSPAQQKTRSLDKDNAPSKESAPRKSAAPGKKKSER